MQFMIVDDNIKIRRMIISILRAQCTGHPDFIECENGLQAVELYQIRRSDLVIMDIEMPVLNGLEAAGQILQFDPKANVIIVTQYNEPEYTERAKKIGVKQFLLKDNLLEICNAINQI